MRKLPVLLVLSLLLGWMYELNCQILPFSVPISEEKQEEEKISNQTENSEQTSYQSFLQQYDGNKDAKNKLLDKPLTLRTFLEYTKTQNTKLDPKLINKENIKGFDNKVQEVKGDIQKKNLDTIYNIFVVPVRNEEHAASFYSGDNFGFLQNVVLSTMGKAGSSAYVEMVHALWGPFRLGFGALIGTGDTTTKKELNNFLKGGGNASLNLSYPLLLLRPRNISWMRIHVIALPRMGIAIPGIDSSTSKLNLNLDLGVELHYLFGDLDDQLKLFLQLRTGYIKGTKEFYTNIGAPEAKSFYLTQVFGGLIIGNSISISVSVPIKNKDWITKNIDPSLNVQLRPN